MIIFGLQRKNKGKGKKMDALVNSCIPLFLKAFVGDCFPVAFPASGRFLLSNHFSDKQDYNCKLMSANTMFLNIINFYPFYQIT